MGSEMCIRDSYKDGKRHGKGKLTIANGNVYEGDWKHDRRNGKGKETYASGNVYEGDFKDNKMHGSCLFTFATGGMYKGGYRDDETPEGGKLSLHTEQTTDHKNDGRGGWAMRCIPLDVYRLIQDFCSLKELYLTDRFFWEMRRFIYYHKLAKRRSLQYYISDVFRKQVQEKVKEREGKQEGEQKTRRKA